MKAEDKKREQYEFIKNRTRQYYVVLNVHDLNDIFRVELWKRTQGLSASLCRPIRQVSLGWHTPVLQ